LLDHDIDVLQRLDAAVVDRQRFGRQRSAHE
jgi:hypothetical protein